MSNIVKNVEEIMGDNSVDKVESVSDAPKVEMISEEVSMVDANIEQISVVDSIIDAAPIELSGSQIAIIEEPRQVVNENIQHQQNSVVDSKIDTDSIECSGSKVAVEKEPCQPGTTSDKNCVEEPPMKKCRNDSTPAECSVTGANNKLKKVRAVKINHFLKLPTEVSITIIYIINYFQKVCRNYKNAFIECFTCNIKISLKKNIINFRANNLKTLFKN